MFSDDASKQLRLCLSMPFALGLCISRALIQSVWSASRPLICAAVGVSSDLNRAENQPPSGSTDFDSTVNRATCIVDFASDGAIRVGPTAQLARARATAFFFLLLTGLAAEPLQAQSRAGYSPRYRTALDYRTFETERFSFHFPAGTDTTTALFRSELAATFDGARSTVGTDTEDFQLPVVVDPRGQSNGVAVPVGFRTNLSPAHPTSNFAAKFDTWPQALAPHELVHAMQYEIDSGVGVGGLVGLFSPDFSRLINAAQPRGWLEGAAVYRESQLTPGAGRLNAPLATMKYRAATGSDDPWSLGEIMYSSRFERPALRHYFGGGQLVKYLAEQEGGTSFIPRTNRWFHRLPFLGFGAALWMGTGSLPHQISDSFLSAERREEQGRLDSLRRSADGGITDPTIVAGTDGLHVRRPQWLSDSTLVAYASGYSTRPGFYRIGARSGSFSSIRHGDITAGHAYSLAPDTTALFFSRPHAAPFIDQKTTQRAHRLNLSSVEVTSVSGAKGVFAPAKAPGGPVYAAQRDGSFSTLVALGEESASAVAPTEGLRYKQIAPSPGGGPVAVLGNEGGRQGIYRLSGGTAPGAGGALRPWLRLKNGTIYDLSWGPSGRYLLFAADPSGIANAYALDTEQSRVLRLTTVRYGALEPSLSPDRETLAFSRYTHERFELATIPFRPDSAEVVGGVERDWPVPGGLLAGSDTARARATGTVASASGSAPRPGMRASRAQGSAPAVSPDSGSVSAQARTLSGQSQSYETWGHLAPRTVHPVLSGDVLSASDPGEDLGIGAGLRVLGADPLQTWTYALRSFYQADRLWGSASLSTGLLPGTPLLKVFNEPLERATEGPSGSSRVEAIEERGVGLEIKQRVVLANNVYSTSLTGRLETELRQTRPISASSDPEGGFTERLTLEPTLALRYHTQQNIRDLVPNTGFVSTTEAEADLATPEDARLSRALRNQTDLYWPLLSSVNGGLRTSAALLTQNEESLFDPDGFVPRGYQGTSRALPGAGTHLRFDLKYTQPLWFMDTGSVMLPAVLDVAYGFALGQAQYRASGGPADLTLSDRRASVGGGLGVSLRLLGQSQLTVNLEVGLAYAIDPASGQDRWRTYGGTTGL
ncbi:hypothetical protein [Salinibacter grassmerensis]|uniref:hypothetical protein n=1 Tax=Salinibacter grassmerensis TaxID=3040353 RepID=UPI0021E87E49|nr:hypothetical protein [Salinibacter grassmerensis]